MTYNAGLVGAGRIGRIHADMYANADGVELAAIAEVDPTLRAERGEAWAIPEDRQYANYEAMLVREDLDAVSVAAPTSLHHEVVLAAAESNSPPEVILCEKPLTESPRQADELVAACDAAGIELVVDHTLRFSETFSTLRDLLADGLLGDIHSVQLHAGGSLMRLGTHYVDLLAFLLGSEIREVRGGYLSSFTRGAADGSVEGGEPAVDDAWGAATFVFEDGTVAQVDETRSGSVANQFTLVGTDGMVVVRGSDASSIFNRELAVDYWELVDGEHVSGELSKSLDDAWARDMSRNTTGSDVERGMYAAQRQFDRVGEHVVALLDGDEENRSPGAEAAHVVEALVAVFISAETGGRVELPLSGSLRSTTVTSK